MRPLANPRRHLEQAPLHDPPFPLGAFSYASILRAPSYGTHHHGMRFSRE